MGRVFDLTMHKKKPKPEKELPKEFSPREEELVKQLYRQLSAAGLKYHEVIICKAIAVYMGDLMTKTAHPGMIIGGFTKHIQAVTNIAIAHHKQQEKENAAKVYGTKHPEGDQANAPQSGHEGAQDASAPSGSSGDLEVKEGQEVLLPPTLQ